MLIKTSYVKNLASGGCNLPIPSGSDVGVWRLIIGPVSPGFGFENRLPVLTVVSCPVERRALKAVYGGVTSTRGGNGQSGRRLNRHFEDLRSRRFRSAGRRRPSVDRGRGSSCRLYAATYLSPPAAHGFPPSRLHIFTPNSTISERSTTWLIPDYVLPADAQDRCFFTWESATDQIGGTRTSQRRLESRATWTW